jgi:UDP-N-acetylglucosamine diphosphorylase / glucose-1-phosphate thymidylyltransferase / UDP-N-acetylgalactosamine diphosphorylase / glucosamine-1-phosphate N-acetyltransferase / galactosamine-1-phosphate N-acetyltransferase
MGDSGHQCPMLSNGLPQISDFVTEWETSTVGGGNHIFWDAIGRAESVIAQEVRRLGPDYRVSEDVAVHETAIVEQAAVVKGPAIIGPNAFIAANAYLRGGVYVGEGCIVGPSCELKTTFMFGGSKVAHLSFVGDSIIGSKANIEAGAIIANYRNERVEKRIRIIWNDRVIETGVEKLGALVGDGVRIGANAVVAPGALLASGIVVPRLALVDQAPPTDS